MKLMTLNCHSWQEDNQLAKIKILAERIKKEQYDVIALQEINQHVDEECISGNIKTDNYVQVLINELNSINEHNYEYVWDFSHIGYDVFEEGLAIVSRHKIKSYDSFYVSEDQNKNNYKSRKIVKATIEANGKEIDIFSCHLGWWNDKDEPFKNQVDNLIKHVDDNKLSFLMGDFNFNRENDIISDHFGVEINIIL